MVHNPKGFIPLGFSIFRSFRAVYKPMKQDTKTIEDVERELKTARAELYKLTPFSPEWESQARAVWAREDELTTFPPNET